MGFILVLLVLIVFIIVLAAQNRRRAISEARFRVLIDHAPEAIVLIDADLIRFVDANPRAEKLFGCNRNELIKSGPMKFYTSKQPDGLDVSESVRLNIERVMAGGVIQIERTIRSEDGRELTCDVRLVRLPSEKQRLIRASYIDITQRKQMEEEREHLQSQLNQAQKMELVGRLAGGVAHDFNNMLGVIIGNTELALDMLDQKSPTWANLMEILNTAQRSVALTRQLLAFARKQTVAPKVLDLNATVESMLLMLRRLIGEFIVLDWRPGKDLWPIKMDPSQIDQVLVNLCINARDAIAKAGKVIVDTKAISLDAAYCEVHTGFIPGDYVLLNVCDNGIGMKPEILAHIFEPFFTTKGIGKGTGMGLATVYGIVKQNNGFINIYSEVGIGTTFNIYLPRYMGDIKQDQKIDAVDSTVSGNETIILVEDDVSILRITKMILEQQGYTVLSTISPVEAICMAKEYIGTIHLLVTDVVMPEMNGKELATRLGLFCPDLKYIFMSGYTANVIAHHGALDEGINFIQKPFSKKDFVEKVRKTLNNKNIPLNRG